MGFWRAWLAKSTYRGRWREMVGRSAMTLKLMTFAPSGALVAAPTTALPEQPGGERNWDYRFTWVRDASYSVGALLALGYSEEAFAFLTWLRDRIEEHVGTSSGPSRSCIASTVRRILWRSRSTTSRVTRTLDRCGSVTARRTSSSSTSTAKRCSLRQAGEGRLPIGHRGWKDIERIINWLAENWDQPDEGVWETRGGRRDFTYGRAMSWVALDGALRVARELGRPADLVRWTAARDAIYEQITERCWNPARKAFVQYHGTDVMDASVLMMPITGFVVPTDPMWLSTLDAIEEELVSDSPVHRYNPSASPDGRTGSEGTFSICTFWYVDALARSGRLDQARYVFEKVLTCANHVGLFSEEIGPTGEQLGNFPQAFSHLSLIGAAVQLNTALDRASASVSH